VTTLTATARSWFPMACAKRFAPLVCQIDALDEPLRRSNETGRCRFSLAERSRASAARKQLPAAPPPLSRLRMVNQRISFLRFASAVDVRGVWHGGEVSGCGER
jgi:hypothetical protein